MKYLRNDIFVEADY